MKIKRYFADDMRQAIRRVREEQGPDAVILSNRKVNGGVEIVAAVDYDESAVRQLSAAEKRPDTPGRSAQPHGPAEPAQPDPGDTMPEPMFAEREGPDLADLGLDEEPAPARRRAAEPEPNRDVVWSQDPAIVAMREEIRSLRGMLETQLSGLAWNEQRRAHPLQVKLLQRLMHLGLDPQLCEELTARVRLTEDEEQNWRQALGYLSRRIPVTDDDIVSQGGVVALVGPTGVGKTTTVAKLAARYALRHGPNRVALVTTDSFRIGAHQQLRTYGRILGVPVHVANDGDELHKILGTLRDKELVLIDTAGMSQRDMRLSEQFAMLRRGSSAVRSYLVLSTTTQRVALEEAARAFGNVPLDGCILTKVDETARLGEAVSAVVRQQLPVAYVADGQRVPEDLEAARANNLVTRSVGMMKRHSEMPGEEEMALTFAGMGTSAQAG